MGCASVLDFRYGNNQLMYVLYQFIFEITYIVRVNTSTSTQIYGSVSLQFSLPKTYPKVHPTVVIADSQFISEKSKKIMADLIQAFCMSNKGRIMCYDVVQLVQDMLQKIGPVQQPKSFYDKMIEREKHESTAMRSMLQAPTTTTYHQNDKSIIALSPKYERNAWISNDWFSSFLNSKSDAADFFSGDANDKTSSTHIRSRYNQEFVELALLGKGGGGEVCKCKNRLDDRVYAIKKVKVGDADDSLYREVRCISSLLHKNIVRYYAAWIENIQNSEAPGTIESASALELSEDISNVVDENTFWRPLNNFEDHDFLQQSSTSDHENTPEALAVIPEKQTASSSASARTSVNACLYIQMEYCRATLRSLIDDGNLWEKPAEVFHLLRQILEALSYIHADGVIHRDLKPANIFLDAIGDIKIGDFGLATFSGHHHTSVAKAPHDDDTGCMTSGVGTALYRAPEFDHTETARRYIGDRADMFSLGIVLFEMIHRPFVTAMERIMEINYVRSNGSLPSEFQCSSENLKTIVNNLVCKDPSKRPSATELLQSPLLPPRVGLDKMYLAEVLDALVSNANNEVSAEIISALFKSKQVVDTFDHHALSFSSKLLQIRTWNDPSHKEVSIPDYALRSHVENSLIKCFETFGAVRLSGLLLSAASFERNSNSTHLLDTSGTGTLLEFRVNCRCILMQFMIIVVSLPADLISSYARYAGRLGVVCSTR